MNHKQNNPRRDGVDDRVGRMIGTRIRERRMARGLAQGALARQAGISPSYLNLIEHNRRRIGGGILLRLAAALEVDVQTLSHGSEAALMAGLREAAGDMPGAGDGTPPKIERPETNCPDIDQPEIDRLEEFAGRFPGWAQLLVATLRRKQDAARRNEALTDRLAHDPHLAASLHEVLSVVTAIRSTASILTETNPLEPEWQARFHRNLGEDSRRLAEGAERLVRYLDEGPEAGGDMLSPQDGLDSFLDAADHHFERLEEGGDGDIGALLAAGGLRDGSSAHELARTVLEIYHADAQALPKARLLDAVAALGVQPLALAQRLGVSVPRVFRRLAAMLPADVGPVGLITVDASGAILTLKPLDGFAARRLAGACPLWPLFRVQAQPGMVLGLHVVQPDRGARPVLALACTEEAGPAQLNMAPLLRGYMLLLPEDASIAPQEALAVGTSCRICSRFDCPARREPSILPDVGAARRETLF